MKFHHPIKFALPLLLLLCVLLGGLRYRQWRNQAAIDQERRRLQEQIAALSKKNQDLNDSLSYLDSADFKERLARQQLNLKRNGEVVFGFTDAPAQTSPQSAADGGNAPNYEKWIRYFFAGN